MSEDARTTMNRMYGLSRHVYDATRKYYLLGRDTLIEDLDVPSGARVCEVGCGTARNLIKMARRWPKASFCGIDASDAMLDTARKHIARAGVEVSVAQGLAQDFIGGPFERIVFSYTLSIIPPWRESLDHALSLLTPNGEIHIVDFGGQEGLPLWFRKTLFWWLGLFGVHWKPEIPTYLQHLEARGCAHIARLTSYLRGYAYHAVIRKVF